MDVAGFVHYGNAMVRVYSTALSDGIQRYVDDAVENVKADKTYTALVTGIYSADDNTYNIILNGVNYNDIPTMGGTCAINETVHVVFPCGNSNNMYINKGDTVAVYLSDLTYNSTTKVLTKIYSDGTTATITLS